jgi:hypothetical protein
MQHRKVREFRELTIVWVVALEEGAFGFDLVGKFAI